MKYDDAKSTFLLEHCAERCDGYQKDDACENCEINAAIEALNKQMPKKPKLKGEYYICPVCGVYQEYLTDGKPPYCVNCGQALDWQEVEE